MAKYQKKQVIIEAFQVGQDQTPEWFKHAIAIGRIDPLPKGGNYMEILTENGPRRAYRNDYVVLSDDGDMYVIKPKLFEATYEPWEDTYRDGEPERDEEAAMNAAEEIPEA